MMDNDLQVPLTNRQKKKKPKSDKRFWCGGCDREVVSENEKCPVCGHIDLSKQARKRDIKVYDTNTR